MQFVKRLARGLASTGFKLGIFLTAVTAALVLAFGTPTTIKESLDKSGIYDQAVKSVLDQTQQGVQGEPAGEGIAADVPLQDAAIRKAAEQAFSPDVLQRSAEQGIDGTYSWLEGDTETPNFAIDLTGVKQNLANAIGDEAAKRVQALPVCTLEQLRQLNPGTSPFDLPCQPPGLNIAVERQKIVNEVASSPDFLKDPVITADDWKDTNGQSHFAQASEAPQAFQFAKKLPWIFGSLSLLLGAGLVFLHESRRRGLFVVARTLLVTGVVLLVGSLITAYLLRTVQPDLQLANTPALQQAVVALIRSLTAAFNRPLLVFATSYTVLGGVGLIALHFTKPKTESQPTPSDSTPQPIPTADSGIDRVG